MSAAPTPGFCERAWSATAGLQEQLVHHPFNEALAAGTLAPARFAYYLVQDSRYLKDFSVALAEAGRRSDVAAEAEFFAGSAQRALGVERALHAGYLSRLLGPGDAERVRTSAACGAYTAFLARAAAHQPYPVLVAALVPCFWVYRHVGQRILARTAAQADHPYRAWIDTYADAAFAAAVDQVKAIADRRAREAADQVPAMLAAFTAATRHERSFWDAAWSASLSDLPDPPYGTD
ncbi:thiaminase II [Acidimicrobiaceae bacterium USS-CC1]|uniref:Thiaminase II n=1 Tax=Acidiferrimicrobium australe TaxID=2664430 RepID=A0ABW9QVQ8_9ACTN|nr:thiaminase II [Acidiferrimicrobium australe]